MSPNAARLSGSFTAIPVGQGDAFLLNRAGGEALLVDGGRARLGFAADLAAEHPSRKLDVVVCTHADADHAEGLIGLLQSSFTVREVWLPGRWGQRLEQLCREPEQFLLELHANILASPNPNLADFSDDPRDREIAPETGASIEGVENAMGNQPDLVDPLSEMARAPSLGSWARAVLGTAVAQVWVEAVQTADRIRELARAAFQHGAKIRWFDFEEAQSNGPGGGEPYLRPCNAAEISRFRPAPATVLRYIQLSLSNKESLVFFSPGDEARSPVLFTADSDLGFAAGPPLIAEPSRSPRRALVTAPHHGSEANANAYGVIGELLKDARWVRSDGRYASRPGATYLALSSTNRFCTLCNDRQAPRQAVRFDDSTGANGWQPAASVRSCSCVHSSGRSGSAGSRGPSSPSPTPAGGPTP